MSISATLAWITSYLVQLRQLRSGKEARVMPITLDQITLLGFTFLVVSALLGYSGGPDYKVPLGRRDGLTFATRNATQADLPAPTFNVSTILPILKKINLDANDLVALSGGHTIGLAHCTSFTNRLYPNQDPNMDSKFAANLKHTCPAANTTNTTNNDILTPNTFDNKYYVDLVNRQGLFTSDQDLFSDPRTMALVSSFANNQSLFFDKFVFSMVKMGQLSVLTGNQGEIRANCSARNSNNNLLWPVVEVMEENVAF